MTKTPGQTKNPPAGIHNRVRKLGEAMDSEERSHSPDHAKFHNVLFIHQACVALTLAVTYIRWPSVQRNLCLGCPRMWSVKVTLSVLSSFFFFCVLAHSLSLFFFLLLLRKLFSIFHQEIGFFVRGSWLTARRSQLVVAACCHMALIFTVIHFCNIFDFIVSVRFFFLFSLFLKIWCW